MQQNLIACQPLPLLLEGQILVKKCKDLAGKRLNKNAAPATFTGEVTLYATESFTPKLVTELSWLPLGGIENGTIILKTAVEQKYKICKACIL